MHCLCWGTADICFLLSDTNTCVPHFSCLRNVLLIYTCWAQGCLGILYLLTTSITQQDSLLPFKIHLKRFTEATVQLGMDAVTLMCSCEKCFTVVSWMGPDGNPCAKTFVSKWAKTFQSKQSVIIDHHQTGKLPLFCFLSLQDTVTFSNDTGSFQQHLNVSKPDRPTAEESIRGHWASRALSWA